MATEQPTAGDSGASSADPIDRIEAFLNAQDGGDSNEQTTDDAQADEGGKPNSAAKSPDKPENDDQAKVEQPQITTAQLAQFLGIPEEDIDVDEDGAPVFKNKIDGKESAAKFADIRKAYQLQGHAENTTRAAAEMQKAAQARMQEAEQIIQARFQQVEQQMQQLSEIAQAQQADLNQEYAAINWPELWQSDPGRAGILRDQFQAKAARIQATMQNVNQRREAAMQQARAQQQANAQRTLQAEAQKLREVIPDWNDRAVAAKEQGELTEWALSRGYDPSYLTALHNAQVPNSAIVIRDLREAWKHDTLQKMKPEIEHKLRTAPKLVKPGQPTNQSEQSATTRKSLLQGIKSASPTHSTKAFEEFLLRTNQA